MNKISRISGGQLTTLLLASRLSNCLLLTNQDVGSLNLRDRLIAVALSGVMLFLLFVPTLLLLKRSERGMVDCAYHRSRRYGRVVCVGYLLLCLFILCLDIVQFHDFAEKVMKGGFSVTALTVALIAVAFAASFYGLQALARTALPVAAFSVLCLVVFGLSLVSEMRLFHFPPLANQGLTAVIRAAVAELPRTAEIVAVGLLYPYVSRARTRSLALFSGLTAVLTALVTVTALGVLGDFAVYTAYPYYAAVTAARLGVFQRLDILTTAVWLGTFFIRLTLFCTLFTDVARRLFGKRARLWCAAVGGGLLSCFALLLRDARDWSLITAVYWIVLGVFCLLLPVLLGLPKRRNRP